MNADNEGRMSTDELKGLVQLVVNTWPREMDKDRISAWWRALGDLPLEPAQQVVLDTIEHSGVFPSVGLLRETILNRIRDEARRVKFPKYPKSVPRPWSSKLQSKRLDKGMRPGNPVLELLEPNGIALMRVECEGFGLGEEFEEWMAENAALVESRDLSTLMGAREGEAYVERFGAVFRIEHAQGCDGWLLEGGATVRVVDEEGDKHASVPTPVMKRCVVCHPPKEPEPVRRAPHDPRYGTDGP